MTGPSTGTQVREAVELPAPRRLDRPPWPVLGAVSAGGALGSLARYALGSAFPTQPGAFPWATFTINVTGCLLIGILMVLVSTVWAGGRLVRPFLGVGVLGGYTTFSTYIVEFERLVDRGAAGTGLAYLTGTLLAALLAVYTGINLTRLALRLTRRLGRLGRLATSRRSRSDR